MKYFKKSLNFIYYKRFGSLGFTFALVIIVWALKLSHLLHDKKASLDIFYEALPYALLLSVLYLLVFHGIPQYLWKSNFGQRLGRHQKNKLVELDNEIASIQSLWEDIRGSYLLTKEDPDSLLKDLKKISESMTLFKSKLK